MRTSSRSPEVSITSLRPDVADGHLGHRPSERASRTELSREALAKRDDGGMNEEPRMEAEDYLHIPYVLTVWSELGPDGDWLRYAEFPELPGVVASSPSATEVIERVDEMRVEFVLTTLARGEAVPVPRPPLRA